MTTSPFDNEKPLSQAELLAGMIMFLLPLFSLIPLSGVSLPQWADYILIILLWVCIFFAIGYAIKKRLPRWSLPYLGFVLFVGHILGRIDRVWGWIYPYFVGSFGSMSSWALTTQVFYVAAYGFITMLLFLLGALLLVNLLRLLPFTRGVWGRIRADWTQLSFLLYGVLVFDILLAFEEYRYEDIWKFAAWFCLALGAWFHLQAKGQKQRILVLIGGATAAKWIVAFAKWALIPLQRWPTGYPVAPSAATRWVETSGEMIGWIWILIMLTAPAILSLVSQSPGPAGSTEEGSITV